MKRIIKTSFILLALLGVLFTSCKKEYEKPPIQNLPQGKLYSIGELLALPANASFDTASVCGIVTADEQSGNLYKTIFIQDRETGKAIELLMNTSSAARIGDSVRVFLDKNIMVNNYHNLPQLVGKDGKGFSPDGHLIIYPKNKIIEPTTVTIADIKTGNYTAGLVRLEGVEFVEQGSAFCNMGENTNRTLKDATGELLVRTSNYANFAYDLLPSGQGSLVAIASVYNNDYQLLIRSKKELNFEGGEPTPPAPAGELQHLPYTQNFSADFGTYTTYNVLGDQVWTIDYSTAKITGHEGGNTGPNYANEDWLISSPVDLTTVDKAIVSMTYIGRYFTKISDEVTLWASTDYTFGGDPTKATWKQIPATLTEASNWNDFLTVEVAAADANGQTLVGQNVTFAVKYTSTDSKAGTMEIQSITIKEGNGGVTPPGPAGDVQSIPYTQSFESEFGTYTTYDVLGSQGWVIDYHTAKMTGYVDPNYFANEDWLISSPVDLSGVNEAKVTMSYIGRYFTNINNEVTLWASTDYTFNGDPTAATWKQIPATLTEASNWNDFQTIAVSLIDASGQPLVGQTIFFAVKYTSTDSKAGTMEVKSITIEEGSGVSPTPPGPTPGPGTGSGTQDDPYDVAAGIANQGQGDAWVRGYIVGCVKAGDDHNSVSSNDDIDWVAPFGRATNVLIADDPTCNDIASCLIVKMKAGSAMRTRVNLLDTPDNLGKQLAALGTLKNGFGKPGLDCVGAEGDFILEGDDPTPTPPDPTPSGELQDLPYEQSFASSFGTYMTFDVTGDQKWEILTSYSCAKMSGHTGGNGGPNYDNEDWLISAPFNVPATNVPVMKMEYAGCFFDSNENIAEDVKILVSSDYNFGDDPTRVNWLQIPCDLVNSTSYTFQTIEVDLSIFGQLMSETAILAVKYTSTPNRAGTIEIKSIIIEEGSGVNPNPPDDPPTPTPPDPTPGETVDVATALTLQGSGTEIWVHGFIVGAVKKNKMATSNDNIDWEAPFTGDRAVLLSDDINETDITNCIVVELPANTELRTQVNLKDNPGNLRRNLSVKGTPDSYLSHEGLKNCPGTVDDFELDNR